MGNQLELTDEHRVRVLTEVYSQTHAEIARYRDMEWKILSWSILLLAGVVAAARALQLPNDLRPVFKTLLCVFTIVAAAYGAWHIHFVHVQLTWNRNLRRKVESLLKLYSPGGYAETPILPAKWATEPVPYTSGIQHLVSWWLLIALVTGYALLSVVLV
jgi:hypothetical protein